MGSGGDFMSEAINSIDNATPEEWDALRYRDEVYRSKMGWIDTGSVAVNAHDQALINNMRRRADAKVDMVNHPPHYTKGKYEAADVLDDWFLTEPHLWNAGKYMSRWDAKGDPVENLEKAIWFINRKISYLKGEM